MPGSLQLTAGFGDQFFRRRQQIQTGNKIIFRAFSVAQIISDNTHVPVKRIKFGRAVYGFLVLADGLIIITQIKISGADVGQDQGVVGKITQQFLVVTQGHTQGYPIRLDRFFFRGFQSRFGPFPGVQPVGVRRREFYQAQDSRQGQQVEDKTPAA